MTEGRFGPTDQRTGINDRIIKLGNSDCLKFLASLDFYDFHTFECRSGHNLRVFCCKNYLPRFGDVKAGRSSPAAYINIEKQLLLFFNRAVQAVPAEWIYILKYEKRWVINPDLDSELKSVLNRMKITSSCNGIQCSKTHPIVTAFAKACFRYNSFVQFVFPKAHLIITPTDHMDIFFSCDGESQVLSELNGMLKTQDFKDLEVKMVGDTYEPVTSSDLGSDTE